MTSELGEFLLKLRGGMSLRKAAEKSGLSHTYIRDLEVGFNRSTGTDIRPTPETLSKLAEAYDYPYENLMIIAGYMTSGVDIKNLSSITYLSDGKTKQALVQEMGRAYRANGQEETIKLLEEQAAKLGLSPSDPKFQKMLSDAFDLLRFAREKNEE